MHVIAGIMWVGNSMLFNWLDRNLEKVEGRRKEHVGRIWLLHSGAFYDVEKTMLAPGEMPPVLHWFKWQSYTTWLTGFALLVVVFYMGDGAMLVNADSGISADRAIDLSLLTVFGSYAFYECTWRLLGKRSKITYSEMANTSLNQVLMRSLNTSITALLPILSILLIGAVILGATTLEEFGLALFLGLLSGAYSSIFIATPLLAVLKEREPRYRELRERLAARGPQGEELVTAGGAPSAANRTADVTPRARKQGKTR